MILSINLIKDGKPGQKPRLEDHTKIMRQAGLNLDEVRGKVGKNGYLEVALDHGAASASRALREGSKEVDTRYTISSVREQGASREVTVKWVGVPFSVQDETLYSYLELFSNPVRKVRNLWWVKEEPGEGLRGVWNAERTLVVHLNSGVGHVPVWHYVGGAKLKLLIPGKRSCPRCMKSVGDCKGGGSWAPCEESGGARGDWKTEQERFLKKVGSSLEIQKALERDLLDVEIGPEDPEMVAEMKAEAERSEAEAEAKEVMVYRVPKGKICGGVRLQGFPEGRGDRKTEKREAILTVIELCQYLSTEEEERLGMAEVEVSRPDRGKKGTVEVKVMLDSADELMRKVWHQLEVPCREEGVKRYMVEASSQMSPVKEKQKTAIQKARSRVADHMRDEEMTRMNKAQAEPNEADQNKRKESEIVQLTEVMSPGESNNSVSESSPPQVDGENSSEGALDHENPNQKETGRLDRPRIEKEDSRELLEVEPTGGKIALGNAPESHKEEKEKGANKGVENPKKGADKTGGQPLPADELDVIRVKGQKWTPPLGKRRCSGNCLGCRTKCKELNLPDCQSCHLNKVRMNNNNGCCNRGPCTNMRQGKLKKDTPASGDKPISLDQAEQSNVDNIISDFESKGMDKESREREDDLHNNKKRCREKGSTPEALQKTIQIARLSVTGGQSKIPAPGKLSLPTQ